MNAFTVTTPHIHSRFMDDMRPTLANRMGTLGVVSGVPGASTGTPAARFGAETTVREVVR